MNKSPLVIYLDIGLVGSFSKFIRKSSEKNYLYLEYYPLNSLKKVVLEKAINVDYIHTLDATVNIKGVEKVIKLIYTGEPGSIVKNILKSDSEELIADLRERIRKLQMQVASSKQNEEDARSGINKAISSMKSITRPSNPVSFDSQYPFNPNNYENSNNGFDGF